MPGGKQITAWAAPDGREAFHINCPARKVIDHITNRWGIWVLLGLRERELRFFELRDRIEGISEKMLSQTLRTLVADRLVWRRVEPTIPPQVTYGLTEFGEGAADHLGGMFDWIRGQAEVMIEACEQPEEPQAAHPTRPSPKLSTAASPAVTPTTAKLSTGRELTVAA
jgi:DNA-binding HxlR family transcriptional regulator